MKISIAMATFNGAAFLPTQLASFATQTRLPDELVVTDDRSTDATPEIIRAFAASAPFPVRFEVNPENLGFALNFSRALSLTTGDLVFLSDQDDLWMDHKIATMVDLADRLPGKVCFLNDASFADGDLVPLGTTKMEQIRKLGLPDTAFVMGCCVAVRRAYLDFILPVPPSILGHDVWIVTTSDALGLSERLPLPLQAYRRHRGNLSNLRFNWTRSESLKTTLKQVAIRLSDLLSDVRLRRELAFYQSLNSRLTMNLAPTAGGFNVDGGTKEKIRRREDVLTRRSALRRMGPGQRVRELTALYREGEYDFRNGVLVAIKDLFLTEPAVRREAQKER